MQLAATLICGAILTFTNLNLASAADGKAPVIRDGRVTSFADIHGSASVTADTATINFVLSHEGSIWQWNVANLNDEEYIFGAQVTVAESVYEIAFTKFNLGGKPGSGSLAELIKAGQVDVWKRDADGNWSATNYAGIEAHPTSAGLTVSVSDPNFLSLLKTSHPRVLQLEWGYKLYPQALEPVEISYK